MSTDETKDPDSQHASDAVVPRGRVVRELMRWGVPATRARMLLGGRRRLDFAVFTRVLDGVTGLPYPAIPMLPGEGLRSYVGRVRKAKHACHRKWFRRIRKQSTPHPEHGP